MSSNQFRVIQNNLETLSLNDFEKGCEVEVNERDDSSSDDEAFDDVEFSKFKERLAKLEDAAISEDDSFEALKQRMEPLTDDGLVLKKLVKCGTGLSIPVKSIVLMHYNAYVANEAEPFDSTYRRNRPYKFLLGDGQIIPALDLCIGTMKVGEISKFIIDSSYGYGEMGCPPRIPGSADLLYEVEIEKVVESGDAIDYEIMTPEERRHAPFEKIVSIYNLETRIAKDHFERKQYKQAIARYRKLAEILEDASVKDEEEDKKREDYLLKTYLNLSQCYLNIENAKKGLKYADLVLKLDPNNYKAIFRKGKGLMYVNDFERSKQFLQRAKQLKPYSNAINAALGELDRRRRQANNLERMFAQKAMGFDAKPKEVIVAVEEETNKDMREFQVSIERNVEKFIDSDEREMALVSGYTDAEMAVIERVTSKYNLGFVKKFHDKLIIKIVKKPTV